MKFALLLCALGALSLSACGAKSGSATSTSAAGTQTVTYDPQGQAGGVSLQGNQFELRSGSAGGDYGRQTATGSRYVVKGRFGNGF